MWSCIKLTILVYRLKQRSTQLAALKSLKKAKNLHSKKSVRQKRLADLKIKLGEFLTGSRLQLVISQLNCADKKSKGFRWSNADKSLALSLLHCSPKCYRMLRKVLCLPSVSTLKRIMQNIQVYPGLSAHIIEALRLKSQAWSPQNKLVVIAIDEMKIKEGISYDKGRDMIEGYCEEKNSLASHALVFMVRGIVDKWKQSVGFFLSSGPMSGSEMKKILLDCISRLDNIGLTVMAVIGDQGSNNQNLFTTILKATPSRPYFLYKDKKVFTIYDPPHLLKNIRNNFKNHGYTVNGHDISWEHIQEFYNLDSMKPVRLAPKLTKTHMNLPPFTPLRVYLAAQVLSHSVATGMKVMAQWGLISEEATHTAEFIDMMDKLFNTFNSRQVSSAAQMQHAFSATSGHKEFLAEALIWIKSIRSKGDRQPACLNGWRMAIEALRQLWEILHTEYNIKFLLTNRLNQDCVENLFSVIRAKMGPNDRPDAAQFRIAFAQTMVDSIMVSGNNTNCKEDVDDFLLNLSRTPSLPIPEVVPSPYQDLLHQLPEEMHSILSVCSFPDLFPENQADADPLEKQEINVLAYIAGYIIRKLRGKVCETCLSAISSNQEVEADNENMDFIKQKRYTEAKDGLIVPNQMFLDVISAIEKKYRSCIENALSCKGVKLSLVNTLFKSIDFGFHGCGTCKIEHFVCHLMVNIRLHHSIKQTNSNLSKGNSSKKLLKMQ